MSGHKLQFRTNIMMNTIRKFGLEYCDLPTMLWNVTVLWRPLTLNIDKRHKKRIPIIFYILATVVSLSCFYVYVISMLWFVFSKCQETGDIITALIVFSLGIGSQIGTFKLIFMFLNKDKVKDLVEAYLKCDSIQMPMSRFSRNIQKTLRTVKKRAIAFWLVIVFNGIMYWAKPIILPGRHLSEDSFIYYGLEPMFESPNYEIAMCVTTCGILFTVYLPANITILLIVVTGYTEAQMLALSEELKHIWEDAHKYSKTKSIAYVKPTTRDQQYYETIKNEYIEIKLKEIVKIHTVNIDLVQKTEDIFRGAIAMEFVLLTIALVAQLLGGLENTYIEMPFALMQVAMDCLVGQRLMDASVVFENAVYDSKWENFNNANMRIVSLMFQNSQKTLTLSAGGVTMLSFTNLTFVLKSIYSTYTALRSTVK